MWLIDLIGGVGRVIGIAILVFFVFVCWVLVVAKPSHKINGAAAIMIVCSSLFIFFSWRDIAPKFMFYIGVIYLLLGAGLFLKKEIMRFISVVFLVLLILFLIITGIIIFLTDYTGFGGLLEVILIHIPLIVINLVAVMILSFKKVRAEFALR